MLLINTDKDRNTWLPPLSFAKSELSARLDIRREDPEPHNKDRLNLPLELDRDYDINSVILSLSSAATYRQSIKICYTPAYNAKVS